MTSTCPKCGTESARVLTEYDRVFPAPAAHMLRYRCESSECNRPRRPGQPKRRTVWDVEAPGH